MCLDIQIYMQVIVVLFFDVKAVMTRIIGSVSAGQMSSNDPNEAYGYCRGLNHCEGTTYIVGFILQIGRSEPKWRQSS